MVGFLFQIYNLNDKLNIPHIIPMSKPVTVILIGRNIRKTLQYDNRNTIHSLLSITAIGGPNGSGRS